MPGARPNSPIFWNWTHKNIPDRQLSAGFRKKQINSLSLHPTVLLNNTTIHFIFILRKMIYIFCYFKNGSNILEEKNVGDENGLQRIHVWTH